MKNLLSILTLLSVIIISCNNTSKNQAVNQAFDESDSANMVASVQEIIYALSLPTDIAELFEKSGTNFNPDLLTDLDQLPGYVEKEDIALVMGALGIDMSYCKIYDQSVLTAEYYESIEILSGELDIPDSVFKASSVKFDQYFDNQDSLSIIINNIYTEVTNYFKKNNQEKLAAITLFGGWIEAMHIAASIYQNENQLEVGTRLLHQKFALNNMISLLSNYQESLKVRGYVLLLNRLRSEYENVEILYSKEGFNIDRSNRKFMISGAEIKYDEKTLDRICTIVGQIHKEIFK